MKAISTVLAVILVVIIVVALVGLTYSFSIALFGVTTEAGKRMTERTVVGLQSLMRVELMSGNNVIVRNVGLTDLSNFTVLINGEQADFTVDPPVIEPDQIGTITITDFLREGDEVTMLSSEGATVTAETPNPCDQAVLCLSLDEGSGETAKDSSPYGNNGTLINMESGDWVPGKYGNALEFNVVPFENNDYLLVPDSEDIKYRGGNMTIEAWIWIDPTETDGGYLISKSWNDIRINYYLSIDSGCRIKGGLRGGNGTHDSSFYFTTTNTITKGKWYHFALVLEGASNFIKLFVDGKLFESPWTHSISEWIPVGGETFHYLSIATIRDFISVGSFNFRGKIDEVRIYNKAIY